MPAPTVRRAPNKWLVTLSISFGTLMGAVDTSIVNVALPHIRGAVGATLQEITWISTGYAIALVLVMPLTGFLGRMVGQKRLYVGCLILFLVGSFLCGLATSLRQLVLYRVAQGLGAGALQPTEQAILRQTWPPHEQGMAMALFGMAVMLGPAIGPTLGGWIVDRAHWSWIFFINLPVGLLGLFMVLTFVEEDPELRRAAHREAERQRKNLDWQGIALLTTGLSTLVYVLEEGQSEDWFASDVIVAASFVAVFTLAAFVVRELTAPVPAVSGVMFAMLMANMFLLPIFMQELLGFTAMQSGEAMLPRVGVMMVVVPIVGRLYNHVPPALVVGFGITMVSLGGWMLAGLTLDSGFDDLVAPNMVQGLGFACLFVPLTTAALSEVPRTKLADAAGLNSLVRQIGGAVGLAAFATLLDTYRAVARADLVSHVTVFDGETRARLAGLERGLVAKGFDPTSAHEAALRALDGIVTGQAAVLAFERLFVLGAVVFLAVLPLLLFLRVPRSLRTGPAHVEA
jgi:DHA2 family multidrug resistance protein